MAIVKRHGSRPDPASTPDADAQHRLERVPFVERTETQKSAFAPESYPIQNKAIQGFISGHRVSVSYYHKRHNQSDYRNMTVDTSTVRGTLHDQYHLIQNFEITLEEGFSLDYDTERTESGVQGRAVLYSGIVPSLGDLFIYNMGDGNMGLFTVTEITPLTWRNTRPHSIEFSLHSFVTEEVFERLKESVVQTSYFDKRTYLGDEETLLLQDDYTHLITLRHKKTVVSQLFFRHYYHKDMATVMSPKGVYDPYLLHFILKKIPFKMVHARPRQLLSQEATYFDHTLWGRLLDPLAANVYGLWPYAYIQRRLIGHRDATITPLANRFHYVVRSYSFGDNTGELEFVDYYALSEAFYEEKIDEMTDLEYMIYVAILKKRVPDVPALLEMLQNLPDDPEIHFYHLPLYLHLIDVAIAQFEKPNKQTRGLL